MIGSDKYLYIDIETYSSLDLKSVGVYKYVESQDFKITLITYGSNLEDLRCVRLAEGETVSTELLGLLINPKIIKVAHNAVFEMVCLNKYFSIDIDPKQWACTAILATAQGLPRSLADLSLALGLDYKKQLNGVLLVNYFAKPNKKGEMNLPKDNSEKWNEYIEYNIQDVRALIALHSKLLSLPFRLTEKEKKIFALDYKINSCGIEVDTSLVSSVIEIIDTHFNLLEEKAKELTGLSNPNSLVQLKDWLLRDCGIALESLTSSAIEKLIETEIPEKAKEVLQIRQELGKSSVKKFNKLNDATTKDNVVKGTLMLYGAERTGRWAGRLVQVQNLPRNNYASKELQFLRELIKAKDLDTVQLFYEESITDLLVQLIRTALIAGKSKTFVISDYSAIEARVIAWLANESWVLEEFAGEGLIYEATASKMFNVDKQTVRKGHANYKYRDMAKRAVLGLGYGGGVNALKAMGADKTMSAEEMVNLVKLWRMANANITKLWSNVQDLAISAIEYPNTVYKTDNGLISFKKINSTLYIKLPSGRAIAYQGVRLDDNKYGFRSIKYQGRTASGTWGELETWGGKIVENITQAIARDVLAWALVDLNREGYQIRFHVHDEVIISVDADKANSDLDRVVEIMCKGQDWTAGLPLKAEAFTNDYYLKN